MRTTGESTANSDAACYRRPVVDARQDSQRALSLEALSYLDALYGFALHLTGTRSQAEDLVQDTYSRALGALARFVPGSNLKAWLFRILRNAFIDSYRRERIEPLRATFDPDTTPAGQDLDPLRGDAELERLRGVVGQDIERALQALPEEQRSVVLLDLEGMTENEIAAVMGCAVGTVKSRLSRARSALRARLQEYAR